MQKTEITRQVAQAIAALEAGDHETALATLQDLAKDLAHEPAPWRPQTAADWSALDTILDAYGRAQHGMLTKYDVHALVDRLAASPPPTVIEIARRFCPGLPARCSGAKALRAIREKLLGPIEAAERASF